jgi:hypothetical protein
MMSRILGDFPHHIIRRTKTNFFQGIDNIWLRPKDLCNKYNKETESESLFMVSVKESQYFYATRWRPQHFFLHIPVVHIYEYFSLYSIFHYLLLIKILKVILI